MKKPKPNSKKSFVRSHKLNPLLGFLKSGQRKSAQSRSDVSRILSKFFAGSILLTGMSSAALAGQLFPPANVQSCTDSTYLQWKSDSVYCMEAGKWFGYPKNHPLISVSNVFNLNGHIATCQARTDSSGAPYFADSQSDSGWLQTEFMALKIGGFGRGQGSVNSAFCIATVNGIYFLDPTLSYGGVEAVGFTPWVKAPSTLAAR